MVFLSSPIRDNSTAWDINDNGWIVGISVVYPSEQHHAVLWTDVGEMQDLGTLRGNSQALGINNRREVVGGCSDLNDFACPHERIGSGRNFMFDDRCVAFIWTEKYGMSQLPVLGGGAGCAHAINDRGLVVGWSYTGSEVHAVVWTSKNGIKDLGTLPGDNESVAYGINNLGQVVGYSSRTSEDGSYIIRHAVIWTVK
jgi:probable HAF family extracellular repeat protein